MAGSSPWGPGISDPDPGATSGEPAAQSGQGLSPQSGPSAARGVVLPALFQPAPAREGQTVSVSSDSGDPCTWPRALFEGQFGTLFVALAIITTQQERDPQGWPDYEDTLEAVDESVLTEIFAILDKAGCKEARRDCNQ